MPKVNVQCDVNIHPAQMADLVRDLDPDEERIFWKAMEENLRYSTDRKLQTMAESFQQLANAAGRVIAERLFAWAQR